MGPGHFTGLSMIDKIEFNELISRARDGDKASLTRLLLSFHDEMKLHIASRVSPNDRPVISVDDVLQESLIDAFKGIGKFASDTIPSFRSWLWSIADNRLISTIRALRTEKRGGNFRRQSMYNEADSAKRPLERQFQDSQQGPSVGVERNEAIEAVNVKLSNLPADQQEAIRARYIEGLSVEETAKAMNRSCGAIRGLLHRAKASLRLAMGRTSKWFYNK